MLKRSFCRFVLASLLAALIVTAQPVDLSAQCLDLCGDVDHDGLVNMVDLTTLINYLYAGAPKPPCYEESDMDDYEVVTLSDLVYFHHYASGGGPAPTCPPGNTKLTGPINHDSYLELEEAVFPANQATLTLHFNLETDQALQLISLPVRIRVDGQIPTSMTNLQLTTLVNGFTVVNYAGVDAANGKILFSFGNWPTNQVGPLSGALATADITMPVSTSPRTITVEWEDWGPVYNNEYSHYPVLVSSVKRQTAWTPDLRSQCLPLYCGDVDGSGSFFPDVSDMSYLNQYLFQDGPAPPCYEEADMDDYQVVTLADHIYLIDYLYHSGPAPTCPPAHGKLDGPVGPSDYLELMEGVVPAGVTTMTLHLRLQTTRPYHIMVFPVRIRVDGQIPTSMTNLLFTNLLDPLAFFRAGRIDVAGGKLLMTAGDYASDAAGPFCGDMATVDITVPVSGVDRQITIEWDPWLPVHNGEYSHYPMLVEADKTTRTPGLHFAACLNICGNADGVGVVPDIADMNYLRAYLVQDGPMPPCHEDADMDGFAVVTTHDLLYFSEYLFALGPPPTCPPGAPKLSGPVKPYNHLESEDGIFPSGITSMTLHFQLQTTMDLRIITLPFRVRVDGQVPATMSNLQVTLPGGVVGGQRLDDLDGKILISLGGTFAPMCQTIATVDITMPAAGVDRAITVDWESWLPMYNCEYSHYPLLLEPDLTAWLPGLYVRDCLTLCGDLGGDGQVNVADETDLVKYLYQGEPPPSCMQNADVDNYEVVTLSDLVYLAEYLYQGGPAPVCPAGNPKLDGPVDPGSYLELDEGYFPIGATGMTLHLNLETARSLHVLSMPFRIRVDGQVPQAMTNLQMTALPDPFFFKGAQVNSDSGSILFSYGDFVIMPVGPLSGAVATVDITMPASPDLRPITLEWDQWLPQYNCEYSHYSMLVEPDKTSWTPDMHVTCCHLFSRGNANGIEDSPGFPVTVADVNYLVCFLFCEAAGCTNCDPPPCMEAGNADGLIDLGYTVTVADLTYLVAYLFLGGPAPPPCP